jgi:TolB-like protein/Tfp pilus assembly protein PilF
MKHIGQNEIEATLAAILASETFGRTERLRGLLSHIVESTLSGKVDNLLGKNIAEDVFGIDATETDNPSAVRVEAGRLRRRLHQYYESEGKSAQVVISVPKGSYVAQFDHRSAETIALPWGWLAFVTRPVRIAFLGIASVIVMMAGTGWILNGREDAKTVPRLVVAEFESQLREADALAFGLTADMVNRLAKFSQIVTVNREREADQRDLSDADYRLSGYVLKGKKGPRLDIELVSLPSGEVMWVDEFGPPEDDLDLYASQLEIADTVARLLVGRRGQISRIEQAERRRGVDRAAYRCVLRYHFYQAARSANSHREIRHCLERGSVTNPDYAEVWSSLAQIYLDELKSNFNPRPEQYDSLEKARDAALKAVELAPGISTSFSILAAVEYFRRDLKAFEVAGRKAVELNPNDADVLSYFAHYLSLSGKWDEGQELQYRAMAMSPGHPPVWHSSSVLNALRMGDYEKALYHAELAFDPGYYLSVLFLTAANAHLGKHADTLEALTILEMLRPTFRSEIKQDLAKRFYPEQIADQLQQGLEIAYQIKETN